MTPHLDANSGPERMLEAHLEWIRALAQALARDPEAAEELAQETCVAALGPQGAGVREFRPWLATVMRNLWLQRGRSQERRLARESEAARGEHSADDLVEQVAISRELAGFVLALDEPYRSAIVMRFWEGLPPREIARRTGTSAATIQNRIARALAQLRERLDRARGSRAEWLAALTPLFVRPPVLTTVLVGGVLVNAKLVIALVLVAVTGSIVALSRLGGTTAAAVDPRPAQKLAHADPALPEVVEEPRAEGALGASERTSAASKEEAARASGASAGAAVLHAVRGRVLDPDGHPLAGLAVRSEGAEKPEAQSGNGGWFEFQSPKEALLIGSADPAWTNVRSAAWKNGEKIEPLLVVGHATNAAGTVQDASGNLLAGARVRFALPAGFETRFDRPLEASYEGSRDATSDAQGRFALPGLPAIAGARLRVVLEGYAAAECAAPQVGDPALLIVLARPAQPLVGALHGRVVDDHGGPVPGARVFLGLGSTLSDEQGNFALDFARAVSSERLVALKAGWRMGVIERPHEPHGSETGWPEKVEIALPGPVLSIRGTVVDAQGKPVPGLRVSLADPTLVGRIGKMPVHAEFLASGSPLPPMALESEADQPDKDGEQFNDFVGNVGKPSAFYHFVETDAEGRFEFSGLDERKYHLSLQDRATCSYLVPEEEYRAGGTPVRIEWPAPKLFARVAGAVVGDEGEPVKGARLSLVREAFGVRTRVFGGSVYVSLRDRRDKQQSGADGSFEFHDVPAQGMKILVDGEGIVPDEFPLSASADPQLLKLKVFERCSFEVVQLSKQAPFDAVALQDEKGGRLDVLKIDSAGTNAFTEGELVDGRSGVLSASSAVRTLVLLRNGVEVQRLAVRLRPGEVNRFEI